MLTNVSVHDAFYIPCPSQLFVLITQIMPDEKRSYKFLVAAKHDTRCKLSHVYKVGSETSKRENRIHASKLDSKGIALLVISPTRYLQLRRI